MGTSLFKKHTSEQQTQAVAQFLPEGESFNSKNIDGTNFRKLLQGLAKEMARTEDILIETSKEHDINCANLLIEEWEHAVGIPDDCFQVEDTLEKRRTNVLVKFALMEISTEDQFIELAAELGFVIEISSGIDEITFPLTFPSIFFDTEKAGRFTMIVKINSPAGDNVFPYTFPLTFSEPGIDMIKCVLRKLKPANTNIIFKVV